MIQNWIQFPVSCDLDCGGIELKMHKYVLVLFSMYFDNIIPVTEEQLQIKTRESSQNLWNEMSKILSTHHQWWTSLMFSHCNKLAKFQKLE